MWLIEVHFILTMLIMLNDEIQPRIEGANDNVTAVSVLLGMAHALRDRQL